MNARGKALPLVLLALLGACSPAYVLRSAAGHAGLLWRRQPLEKTIADPRTPEPLRRKLAACVAVRRFAFETLGLKRSHDYEKWTPVEGPAVTWLVSASERLRLKSREFSFPFIGSFPYKGHFRRAAAEKEAAALEAKGFDAAVSGAAAYNTPLPIADPLPQTLLAYSEGDLAETLIHELAHGAVFFKDRMEFNEAAASWVGRRGAESCLEALHGPDSAQLREWRAGLAEQDRRDALYKELRGRLETLYAGPGADGDKLQGRDAAFAWARREAGRRGIRLPERLNNATVLAHELYAPDFAPFDALLAKNRGDWPRTLAALRALDRKDPLGSLRRDAK